MVDQHVGAFVRHVGDRLVGMLLFGSWAIGEAVPGRSDVDLAIVVDTIDDDVLDRLRAVWDDGAGFVNVYGADEVPHMREGLEAMVNAVTVWGRNPFTPPTPDDLRRDLARQAEAVARDARCLDLYDLTLDERRHRVRYATGKHALGWGLRCAVTVRTGTVPRTTADVQRALSPIEAELVTWLDGLDEDARVAASREIGRRLGHVARGWFALLGGAVHGRSA